MAAAEPILLTKHVTSEKLEEIRKFVDGQLEYLISTHSDLFNNKLEEWRRVYNGIPKYATRTFPWKNASNVVIQLVGQHCDTLLATILGSIYGIMPIYPVTILGDWTEQDRAEEQRNVFEELLNYVALEPRELDLYRVESLWFAGTVKYGDMTTKTPYKCDYEGAVTESGITSILKYEGPKPEVIPYQDFLVSPNAVTVEEADFKSHIIHLKRYQLEERKEAKIYPVEVIEKMLLMPDRNGPDKNTRDREGQQGINQAASAGFDNSEWDIYECYFSYYLGGIKCRIIFTYHKASQQILKAVFNFYPRNVETFNMARLGYKEDGIRGYGFCEMLKFYQEEVSASHNQAVDNRTLANCSVLRVNPQGRLDAHISLYPMATIPGAKDDVEVMQLGSIYAEAGATEREMLTLKLASDRSGVEPGPSGPGLGTGTVGKTSGAYSSMGTISVMEERNKRVNMNTTDMRYAHIKLGRTVADIFAEFGIGDRKKYFGTKAEDLEKALDSYKMDRLGFRVQSATASVNQEVSKQNNLLLTTILEKHYTGIGQMIQAVQNQQIDPVLRNYLLGVIKGSDQLMGQILQDFGFQDKSRILPKPNLEQGAVNGQPEQGFKPELVPAGFGMEQAVPTTGSGY
jgi:hypothetical protein